MPSPIWPPSSSAARANGAWAADALDDTREFVTAFRDPAFVASLADTPGPRHLDPDFELVQDTFRRFADEKLKPIAEHIHRENADIPEDIISGLAEMGGFGLSVPEEYGGYSMGGESEYIGMVVATEELSRGSLGAGGSLITRPEILTRALLAGGTEEQKHEWLPKLASAEAMAAVAVTEPDFGSDVAGVKVTATRVDDGERDGWLINGVKTWCTFGARANVLMLLARTDPDRSKTHRGLSMFVVPKPTADGHGFELAQDGGGKTAMGRWKAARSTPSAIAACTATRSRSTTGSSRRATRSGSTTVSARASTTRWPASRTVVCRPRRRAVGVMQAAYESALQYARDRVVFGQPVADYQLTQVKLGRMAFMIQAGRQFSYQVAKLMAQGHGQLEASMVKAYVCKAAEWVTREAMQIHGGFGYAEEYDVSRYFVDARVLSIFEGTDELLCMRVIARRLLDNANA